MRKKLVSLALAATIMVSTSLPAFATKKFDMSVFDGLEYVGVVTDEMTNESYIYSTFGVADNGGTYVISDDGSRLSVLPTISTSDSYDFYKLSFTCIGSSFSGLNSAIVKIGDNRYKFTVPQVGLDFIDGTYLESFDVPMKKELISFMNDLIEHRNEEIKVRLVGSCINHDFTLTDTEKIKILSMYNLFVAANGTREKNMHDITEYDPTIVEKNGKVIQGNITEKILTAALDSALYS